jgi:hypothetical protein
MTAKWLGIFPIICVVITVICLFLPIMHLVMELTLVPPPNTIEGDILPFGGSFLDELEAYAALYPSIADQLSNYQNIFMWVGILFAIFYGLDALMMFINGIKVMTGRKEIKKVRKKWLTGGLGKIISQIIVLVAMITVVPNYLINYGIDFGFTMGLGMILTMISGGILIFAYICAKIAD